MTQDGPRGSPIKGDERREASASLAGYIYQLWHSVYAWLRLGDSEILYLEGAEDYDVVHADGADTAQVKNSPRPITLNSLDVVTALDNYLTIREKNKGRDVNYRYITRATVGKENGDPFGPGQRGMEVWNRIKRQPNDAKTLIDFLRRSDKLPQTVTAWLGSASDEQVVQELILPITWETDQPGAQSIERTVKDLLANHGAGLGVTPTLAEKVSGRLFRESAAVASRDSERHLTRANFLRIFEEETAVTVPANRLTVGSAIQPMFPIGTGMLGDQAALSIQATDLLQTTIPPITKGLSSRQSTVNEIETLLEHAVLLNLIGSSGAGKSTLAKFAQRKSGMSAIWLDCAHGDLSRINAALKYASLKIQSSNSRSFVVIDGLDTTDSQSLELQNTLASLLFVVDESSGAILITSQREIPARLLRSCAGDRHCSLQVPHMTDEEIAEVLTENGAQSGQIAEAWAKIILLHTSGHAQLVHARVLALKSSGWPQVQKSDLIETPKDVELEKEEVRRRLFQDLDQNQLELLDRLSIMHGVFRREHAIHIGKALPSIPRAADLFDQLVGPWVEKVGDDIYRVSPLISGVARQVWSDTEIADAHSRVAVAILGTKTVTTYEAQSCLFHAFMGKETGLITIVAVNLLTAPIDVQEDVATQLSWLLAIRTDNSEPLFPDDPFTSFALRSLQFRVAAIQGDSSAPEIAEALINETVPHEPLEVHSLELMGIAAMLLINYTVKLPAKTLIQQLGVVANLEDSYSGDLGALPADFEGFRPSMGVPTDTVSTLTTMLVPRFGPPAFLREFLEQLDSSPNVLRKKILDGLLSTRDWNLFIDQTWSQLDQLPEEERDWEPVIDVMKLTISYGKKWHREELIIGGSRALAVIYDEYLDDKEAARRALQDRETVRIDSLLIRDALASILYHEKDYVGALEIWDDILDDPKMVKEDGHFTFSFAKAGKSAEEISDYKKATRHYANGAEAAAITEITRFQAAYLADAGFAAWKGGDLQQSLGMFRRCLEIIEELDRSQTSADYLAVRRLISHTLLFVEMTSQGKTPEEASRPSGLCTGLNYNKSLADLPTGNVEFSWMHLMQIEHNLEAGETIFEKLSYRLCQSKFTAVRCFAWDIVLKKAIAKGLLDEAIAASNHYQSAMIQSAGEMAAGSSILDEGSVKSVSDQINEAYAWPTVVGIVLSRAMSGRDVTELVDDLKRSPWSDLSTSLETALKSTHSDVVRAMRGDKTVPSDRMFAALRLCLESAHSTKTVDLFYAHALLADGIRMIPWRSELAKLLSIFARDQWLDKADHAAGSLLSPGTSVPAIKAACDTKNMTLASLGNILLAVAPAVRLQLPDATRQELAKWAAGNC